MTRQPLHKGAGDNVPELTTTYAVRCSGKGRSLCAQPNPMQHRGLPASVISGKREEEGETCTGLLGVGVGVSAVFPLRIGVPEYCALSSTNTSADARNPNG